MRIWNREIPMLMLKFTWIESRSKTNCYHLGAKKIEKSVQALYLISKNLHSIWIFSVNNSLLIVQLGIFASNVFVFVFFYEKHIRDFLKRREKARRHQVPTAEPAERGGCQVYRQAAQFLDRRLSRNFVVMSQSRRAVCSSRSGPAHQCCVGVMTGWRSKSESKTLANALLG